MKQKFTFNTGAMYAVALAILLIGSSSAHAFSRGNAAALGLLRAFSSGCSSYGNWTQSALAQSQALENAITSLKGNANCQNVAGAISSARSLVEEIQKISQDPVQTRLKEAQEKKRQFLVELSSAKSEELQKILISALAQAEIDYALAKTEAAALDTAENRESRTQRLSRAIAHLNTILSDPNLSQCVIENPHLGVQIGAEVIAVSGTFVNPAIGVALSTAGQLISNLMAFINNAKIDSEAWKVQSIELAVSLSCGLESMQNTYCSSQDLYTLAKIQAQSSSPGMKPNGFWADLDLWSNRLPVLLTWLSKVKNSAQDPLNTDARGLLVEATQNTKLGKPSPIEVLQEASQFLDTSYNEISKLNQAKYRQMLPVIEETLGLLHETEHLIQTAPGNIDGDLEVIRRISSTLHLETGFLVERFNRHLKWDLSRRLTQGENLSNLKEILYSSGRGAADEFDSVAHLDKLLEDVSNTQSVSQQNIEHFVEFYADGFTEVLTRLNAAADRAREPWEGPKRPNRRVQSRICVLLASSVSQWPQSIDPALCEGAVVESIYSGYVDKIKFSELKTKMDLGVSLDKRICTYRDYLRRSSYFGSVKPFSELMKDLETIKSLGLL